METITHKKLLELYEVFRTGTGDGPWGGSALVHAVSADHRGGVRFEFDELLMMYYPTLPKADARRLARKLEEEQVVRAERERWSEHCLKQWKGARAERFISLFGDRDADGAAFICMHEFMSALDGLHMSSDEVNAMFQEHDRDGNGKLELDEFSELMAVCNLNDYVDKICVHEERRLRDEQKRNVSIFDIFASGLGKRDSVSLLAGVTSREAMNEAVIGLPVGPPAGLIGTETVRGLTSRDLSPSPQRPPRPASDFL